MLQNSAKNRSEQLIYQRRQQDAQVSKLSTKLRQEHYEKTFAAWENKGKTIQQVNYQEQRLAQMREESNARLVERKEKLANLLAEEHEQFKQEILNMVETPEQVKERMMQQVQELKAKKEADKKSFADSQYERRFRENADELRKVESQFNELQAVAYRNMQMIEKQKMLENQYEEEMIYAQLYQRDIKKKERLELQKLQQASVKEVERNKVVAIQQQINEQKKQQELEQIAMEKQMLKEEWMREEERHKKVLQDYAKYNNEIHEEIAANNENIKEQKRISKMQEKEADKEMVRQVLAKEQAIAMMEQQAKERQKEETKQFLLNFKNRASEYNNGDALKDKLIEEENRRQWEMKEKQWAKEEEARVKLMYEVYDQRAQNVNIKKQVKQEEFSQKEQDKDKLIRDLEAYEAALQEKRKIEAEKIQQTKVDLLKQMDEKQHRQHLLREQKQREEEQIKREKEEYQKKIDAEKARGRALLDELRKQRPY